MRRLSLIPIIAMALLFAPSTADAITLREIVELSRAGIGDDVLLALIEIDQRVFPIDTNTLRMLKESGVSEKVIVAIVRSGRVPAPELEQFPPDATLPPPEPEVVVVERERPVVREVAVPVAVPVPVYVPVVRRLRDHRDEDRPKPAPPVYWGWGGKLRPDAWKPAEETRPPDPRNPRN